MLAVVRFKGCRRCGGDLFLDRDDAGYFICCLQCGAVYHRLPEPAGKVPVEIPAR